MQVHSMLKKFLALQVVGLMYAAPTAFAFDWCAPQEVMDQINSKDVADQLGSYARGNSGSGRLTEACLWDEGEDLKIRLSARIRHRHKTNGLVIYDTVETVSARSTLLNCEITDLDVSSSGFLTDAVLRNRYLLGEMASLLGQSMPLDVMPKLPRDFYELCAVE